METMRHVWLPSLRVWAQAQEPSVGDDSPRGLMSRVDIVEASSCHNLESREDSATAASCSTEEGSLTKNRKSSCCRRYGHHHSPDGAHSGHHQHYPDDHHSCYQPSHNKPRHHHRDAHDGGHHHNKAYDEHGQHHNDEPHHHHDAQDSGHPHTRCHDETYAEHHQHHHDDPHHTCPICLSPITQSNLTVLRWCMHRFCITCIEKWSCMQSFCPLCKQIFNGWYYNIQSPALFDQKDLAGKSCLQTSSQLRAGGRRERCPIPRQPTSVSVRRSKPLPWRRAFGFRRRSTSAYLERVPESKADEEALQWRASIYKRNLRAVPPHVNSRVKVKQAPANDPGRKARIERRLEPWIHRELRAITGDLDPSLLVHLALSLWLRAVSKREKLAENGTSGQRPHRVLAESEFGDVEALRQLEPVLQEKASTFWHELRCFAESPYSLRAYDSVTKYEKIRG